MTPLEQARVLAVKLNANDDTAVAQPGATVLFPCSPFPDYPSNAILKRTLQV